MPGTDFDAFRAELETLKHLLLAVRKKTVRDEMLRDRFRTLFRTWVSTVRPSIEPYLESKREFFKLCTELECLAKLTSKIKPVDQYRKRLNRVLSFVNGLVLYLPPTTAQVLPCLTTREELFVPAIPDLPLGLVPNSLVGWKREIEAFVNGHPFDKSIFMMIRYRQRNDTLIKNLKRVLSTNAFHGILASEHNLTNDLYNAIACLLCCSKGIVVFDRPEPGEVFNPNVAYELGMMHLLGRECLILKHTSLESLHTDILMKLYVEYTTPADAESNTREWIINQ